MDLSRLTRGEQIAGAAGVVLLLSMFIFDWFGVEAGGVTAAGDAWEVFSVIDIVLFLAAAAGIALALIKASDASVDLPVPLSALVVGLGALATILVLIRIISPPDLGIGDFESTFDVDTGVDHTREIGAFIGLIVSAVLTYGGYLAMQEEGTSFGKAREGR